jgi:hypothetical protein
VNVHLKLYSYFCCPSSGAFEFEFLVEVVANEIKIGASLTVYNYISAFIVYAMRSQYGPLRKKR